MQLYKDQSKQLQNKSLTQSLINENPLQFLGNLLGCGIQKNQIKNDSLVNPVIHNLLRSNESMINTSYQARKWQDQQNQHHFKQSRSIFIHDSFEQEKPQTKEKKGQKEQSQSTSQNNNNILKSIFGLLDSVQNETNQDSEALLQKNKKNQNKLILSLPKIQQVQNKVQGQRFLQYHLKVSYVHQIDSDPDMCESFVYENNNNFNYMHNQSSHFIEFDQKCFEELNINQNQNKNKKESQKSQKQRIKLTNKQQEKIVQSHDYHNLKVQDSDINNISIIERSSNHTISSQVQTSFATDLQQDKKNSSSFFMSRNRNKNRNKNNQTSQNCQKKRSIQIKNQKKKYGFQIQKEKEKEKFNKQGNRMAATVQVKPNKIFQQNKTLKFNQFASQPKSKEKQKKYIRKTRSRIISEDQQINTPSASQRPLFQFSSLEFLAAIVQKNGAKYSIKINQGLDNINIEVVPSQQMFLNSSQKQNQQKKQINSQGMMNSVNANTGYFKNGENHQKQNKKSQQRKISLCQSIEIQNNCLQKKAQIKSQMKTQRKSKRQTQTEQKNIQKKRSNSMNLVKREQKQIKQQIYEKGLFIKKKPTNKKVSEKNSTNNSIKQVQPKQNQLKKTLKKYDGLGLKVSRNKKNSQQLKSSSNKRKENSIQNKNKSVQKQKSLNKRNPINKKQFSYKKNDMIEKSLINGSSNNCLGRLSLLNQKSDKLIRQKKNQPLSKQVLLNGKERFLFSSTDYFEGCFQNGIKNGYGIQKFMNGNIYKGEYKNNKFQGKGIYEWQDGSIYEGQFKEGKINGYGVWKTSKQPANLNLNINRRNLENNLQQTQNQHQH